MTRCCQAVTLLLSILLVVLSINLLLSFPPESEVLSHADPVPDAVERDVVKDKVQLARIGAFVVFPAADISGEVKKWTYSSKITSATSRES